MSKNIFHFLTILTVITHLLFILFVIVGGFLAHKSRWVRFAHIASVVWAVFAELSPGVICPLTTLENYFGYHAGITTYKEDFITRYLIPVIYQDGMTSNTQWLLAGIVIIINIIAYWIYFKTKKAKKKV